MDCTKKWIQTSMMCHDSDLALGRWHDALPTILGTNIQCLTSSNLTTTYLKLKQKQLLICVVFLNFLAVCFRPKQVKIPILFHYIPSFSGV